MWYSIQYYYFSISRKDHGKYYVCTPHLLHGTGIRFTIFTTVSVHPHFLVATFFKIQRGGKPKEANFLFIWFYI